MNPMLKLFNDNRGAPLRQFAVNALADGSAEIMLYDVIVNDALEAEYFGGVAPEPFIAALKAIDAPTIHLRINSPGGSVFGARAMETALREHPARIVAHIDALAASAASFLAMAGDEIVMSKGAMMMVHKAWVFDMGNADDLRRTADLLDKIDGTLVDTYAARSKADAATVDAWMAAETWFTADEAVAAGLADSVANTEPKAKARWNLSAYGHAPKAEPPAADAAPPNDTTPAIDAAALIRRVAVHALTD